jgi:iron complex outermembrane recepter protein
MDNLFQKLMLGGSTIALLSAIPLAAQAQQAQPASGTDIEQVVVSASRISIAGYQQPTPVTVVSAAKLDSDAFANIQDAVRDLPQVYAPPSSISATSGAGGGGTAGESLLNLRNLGVSRTLVLFDGQRVVSSNITGGVDISSLPTALIQRVDIVTGGASATWGSDAVAGVVNFVLNKNFDGLKANLQFGDTSGGLAPSYSGQVDWGGDIDGGRGHVIFAASANVSPNPVPLVDENWYRGAYLVSNPTYAAGNGQSQFIVANNVGLAAATEGGLIISSPAVAGTNTPANALRGIQFTGQGVAQTVNFGNVTLGALSNGGSLTDRDTESGFQLVGIPSYIYTAFAYGRYKLTSTIQASMQLNYGNSRTYAQTTGTTQTALVIKSDNAFIPASVRATIAADQIPSFTLGEFVANNYDLTNVTPDNYFRNLSDSLYPTLTQHRQLMRGVFTLEGTLGDDWSWNAYYQHSTSQVAIHILGDPINANLTAAEDAVTVTAANRGTSSFAIGSIACRSALPGQAAVTVGAVTAESGCIPLNVFGIGVASPAAINYITGVTKDFEDMILNQDVVEGSMQGTLPWGLPAGKVAVSFGAGYRKEQADVRATAVGTAAGYSGSNYSAFPSAGYSVLEGFAEVDAPILKNQIVESLDVQGAGRMTSYSTSGLVETWKLGATSQLIDDVKLRTTWSVDIRAPNLSELFTQGSINTGTVTDPRSQLTVVEAGIVQGNPNLQPEVARTVSGGIVLTPTFIPGLSFSADWYSIDLTGEIATISTTTILNQCNPTKASTIHPGQLGNINDPLCTALIFNGPNGALSEILQEPINIASLTTSGLDLQANYVMEFWEGSIAWAATANLTDELTTTQPGTAVSDTAGSAGAPKWRGILSADYIAGPYSFTIQGRWFGTSVQSQTANTGQLATAQTANLYPTGFFEVPFTAYLDLRASYKWNENIQFYGAIDNATDVPPPLIAPTSSSVQAQGALAGTNLSIYDLLGRTVRVGVRFNY